MQSLFHDTRRGFAPQDAREFGAEAVCLLREAQADIIWLLDRGYDQQSAVSFVGNRFRLSARQRAALLRSTCATRTAASRAGRMNTGSLEGRAILIDGFNLIITLEAAQSPQTTLLACRDGCIRDLCGLHGTYRIIASTQTAIRWTAEILKAKKAARALVFLDAPVSNSGCLKTLIREVMEEEGFPAEISLEQNADQKFFGQENAVSSDALILERCASWINLAPQIIAEKLPGRRIVNLKDAADSPPP
jgi:hypothetical protein